jgi:hypothetical protein
MNDDPKKKEVTSRQQLGVILKPKNLLRTVASVAPFSSPALEIQTQLDNHRTSVRIDSLETADARLASKLQALEQAQPKQQPTIESWSRAVSGYTRRIVDFTANYDASFHSPSERGRELTHWVSHGCFVAPDLVLTCSEALEMAQELAESKGGSVRINAGMGWYDFEPEPVDETSGLVLCKITGRDEARWQDVTEKMKRAGLPAISEPLQSEVAFNVTPWPGDEVGFLHTGEATDTIRMYGSHLQFDTTVVSHLKHPADYALKQFVTNVLPGRIARLGSPVFTRAGVLVGIIADTESYPSDAGRRAIVKSLLGHPRYTKFTH